MALTYTTTLDRDRRREAAGVKWLRRDLGLTMTAVVSALTIALCFAGRIAAFDVVEAGRAPAAVTNLAQPSVAETLEPALAPAFTEVADRRFAARVLARELGIAVERAELANVGAIARIMVPAAEIERTRGLVVFAERLQAARARATAAKAAAPASVPLFTAADLTAVKPRFVVRTLGDYRSTVLWCALALVASFQAIALVWRMRGLTGDRLLLAAAHLLTTLGAIVMISRPDPLRDTILLVRYTQGVMAGALVCVVLSFVKVRTSALLQLSYLSLASAILLSIILMLFGGGPGSSGAKVNLGPMQPIDLIRLLLSLFLAGYLGRRWELIRQVRETEWRNRPLPAWLNVPRFDHVLPVLGGVCIALLLFFALKDLGPALLVALTFLVMLAVARAGVGAIAIGVLVLCTGFFVGYWLDISDTLSARVAMWQSPWDNAIRRGDQIAHAAWAMANGAIAGTGLGLGDTRYLPAGHTDLVLVGIAEELGFAGILVAAAAAAVVAWRGLRIARSAPTDTAFFLALALTLTLVVPMLVMAAGLLGLIPLTGVVTPFVSYGGSAMLANFAALGLLSAIASASAWAGLKTGPSVSNTAPFRVPLRWVGAGLASLALVVLAVFARVQVVSADEVLVRPQLGVQADGGRRYQYNPRVLEAARTLPRGAIFDRRGVPMAADFDLARKADATFGRMGISLGDACPDPSSRCYPLGGRAFHVVGDAETRTNWAASNSSYVERDAEDNLRGFDDHSTTVRSAAGDLALSRDYRDLVPLVRHRWEPKHPDVVEIRTRPRDLHITVDARLQSAASSIVARTAVATGIRNAAAVVLDATTGEVLASVSYPWPAADDETSEPNPDALLDRARYGLYPPGSTFKLVTAAAALRTDPALSRAAFSCSLLPDGRVGAKIPGWSRPVRDDVLDRRPHGTIAMHDAMVHSCNAYFAQMAVRLGVEPLAHTAELVGLVFPSSPAARVRENLPPSGYGQGDVLATPLRMARLAAAIATDGQLREPPLWGQTLGSDLGVRPRGQTSGSDLGVRPWGQTTPPRPFLPAASARLLAGYMRDVVLEGTGRSLRGHRVHIAGKTGTAEVNDARSHSWFVGFASADTAERRIAFAVILENAGYGGAGAAAVAGQIVTAAVDAGLIP